MIAGLLKERDNLGRICFCEDIFWGEIYTNKILNIADYQVIWKTLLRKIKTLLSCNLEGVLGHAGNLMHHYFIMRLESGQTGSENI